MKYLVLLLLPLAAPLAQRAPATPPNPQRTISLLDRNLSLQMLANVKADLRENYYDKTLHGMDVDAAFAEAEQRISVAEMRMRDGGALEHKGVIPDEIVLPTAADLAGKRDPALARAVAILGGTITAEQAGQLFKQ
jgi:hypothetical protein